MNDIDEALLNAYYRYSYTGFRYLITTCNERGLSAEERRVIHYLIEKYIDASSRSSDEHLEMLIETELKQTAVRIRTNKSYCIAEGIFLGFIGVALIAFIPGISSLMATASLLSLIGMISFNYPTISEGEKTTVRAIVRWIIIALVTITLAAIVMSFVGLPLWGMANDHLGGMLFGNRFGAILLFTAFSLLIAFSLAGGYFIGMRLWLFIHSIKKKGVTATIRLIPAVWVSRGFLRSVFDSPEIVPGYPADSTPYPKFSEMGLPAWNVNSIPLAIAIPAVDILFSIISVFAALVFKLTLFYFWPLAYLAQIMNIKSEEGGKFVISEYRSRFAQILLFIAAGVLVIAFARVVLILNFDVIFSGSKYEGIARDSLMSIHLWTLVSTISAIIVFLTTKRVDQLFSVLKDQGSEAVKVMPGVRMAILGIRVRQFLVAYTLLCTVALAVPWLRDSVFPYLNPLIWSLR